MEKLRTMVCVEEEHEEDDVISVAASTLELQVSWVHALLIAVALP